MEKYTFSGCFFLFTFFQPDSVVVERPPAQTADLRCLSKRQLLLPPVPLYLAETLGVIGDATPGAWDNSTALTPSADFLVWTGDVEFKAGGEWKLRANNAWDVNLGGDMNNLSKDGSNIATPGEGVYTVTLDLSKLPYTVSVAKK